MSKKQIIDGCTAATYVAYALCDIATIYPISPIAEMGEVANTWVIKGVKNVFGQPMQVRELESELGAAGATHGALAAGGLACTFTCSQGLMLMIPNMHKIAGELLPGVFHIGTRSVANHALSIFGDHQDVMGCRSTGFAFLASSNVQETIDLGIVAHLAAMEGRVPVLHFFDGWRTANEMATVDVPSYDEIGTLVDFDIVRQIRLRGMNPETPQLRGSAQDPDVYFQNREACNSYYNVFPDIVQRQMDRVARLTGRQYHLFDYHGAPDADTVVVAMASSIRVVSNAVDYLNARGHKTGAVTVRLYRPFRADRLMEAIPSTVRNIAVLDRTKESGAPGEPLYLDVCEAVLRSGRHIRVVGGRYGLGSKEFDPSMACAVFNNARATHPVNGFTVGIDDDVTRLSLDCSERVALPCVDVHQAVFYGIGADGTVGATKMAASILGGDEGMYAQAFFSYSAKKSGGYTISQLRVGDSPIDAEYSIEQADYVGCNKDTYVKNYPLTKRLKAGGMFVINSSWTLEQMEMRFPASLKRDIARLKARVYNVDAVGIARKCGLGVRVNTVMLTVYLKLSGIMDFDKAVADLKRHVSAKYMHEGGAAVKSNLAAIDMAVAAIEPVAYPASWATAHDSPASQHLPFAVDKAAMAARAFYEKIGRPCMSLRGDTLPVSYLTPDGTMPMGTTAYEKRCIAINVPLWDVDKCVECTECSMVCPHAAIRPVVMDDAEKAAAPAQMTSRSGHGALSGYQFRIQVYVEDCTGCGSCALVCPGRALTMVPFASQLAGQAPLLDYAQRHVTVKEGLLPRATINGSQLYEPLLEFSGACAGCGETPYVKLVTQLFGERMIVANATGCSSVWGANFPSNAYCCNRHGMGPAWGNSLFEDNAEYGYGIAVTVGHLRNALAGVVRRLASAGEGDVSSRAAAWLAGMGSAETSRSAGDALVKAIGAVDEPTDDMRYVLENSRLLAKKSIWCIGGDGWAYDIGFGGLDHVLAQNIDINILVLDTECYSNTGGQTSKATPMGAVAKYSEDGKRTRKKDLGRMMMTYGNVYVAQVALGAGYQQTINALVEAEAYDGPSLVIAYCPCIEHGIRAGLGHSILEEREAVRTGYWVTYRYNLALVKEGKNPLVVDSGAPELGQLLPFVNGEDRYVDLKMTDPAEAAILQPELRDSCDETYAMLVQQEQMPLPPTPAGA